MPDNIASENAAAGDAAAFFRRLTLFFHAALFAVLGQWLAAGAMSLFNRWGVVDFRSIDPSATAPFNILAGVFVLQIMFVLIGLASAGVTVKRVIVSLAALVWAISWLMFLFVALQCDLYGACL